MDLLDSLQRLAGMLPRLKDTIQTEEATKNALVMPVLQALGYNVFDPFEVVPEYTADVGTKKNEKVDYVLMRDGSPSVLIECKALSAELGINHASQLYRYFACTSARLAILTNGQYWQFYTDIDSPNVMDGKPFFEFNLAAVDSRRVAELKKISKEHFDVSNILNNAASLKYKQQIRTLFSRELESPSEDFVRLFAKQVYDGVLTTEKRSMFTQLVGSAFKEWVNAQLSEKLQTALDGVTPAAAPSDAQPTTVEPTPESATLEDKNDGIVTTAEEIEGYHIVRAILSQLVDPDRVTMRDTKSYCGILLDDNNRKPLCRFYFTASRSVLVLVDKERNEERIELTKISDIGKYADKLIEYAKLYL